MHPASLHRIPLVLLAAAAVLTSAAAPAAAQGPGADDDERAHGPAVGESATHEPTWHEGLGSLAFPTSGAPEARADFERGVLLLHSFEYDDAAAAFRAAQEADPGFAMAYWGEAMTHNHPVWDQQDRAAALEALERYAATPAARAERAPTERERRYLEAVDVLYGEGDKARRDTLYGRAMADLAEDYPDDFEAGAFHALSILGLSRGERDVPAYMRAGALALDLFEQNPDHPGAAHYAIHSFDDPTHAPLGLEAALAYAGIAPDAAHAQHMTSHVFLALGMWEEVVEANERALEVFNLGRAERGAEPTMCGHYAEWLAYGYQQRGRVADSEALVEGCLEQAAASPGLSAGAEDMRAMHVASTEDLDGAVADAALDPDGWPEGAAATVLTIQDWTAGFVAARRGRAEEAARRLDSLERRLDSDPPLMRYVAPYAPVWRGTLRSVVAAAEGDLERAVDEARRAAELEAELPVDYGPPVSFEPPRELEGEMLLEAGRAREAVAAFRQALARTPRRASALEGLVRAAEAAGEEAVAAEARSELEAVRAVRDD